MIEHILEHPRAGVFAGMGTGKTGGTLAALHQLALVDDRPILVTAPLRVAEDTWPDAVRKWSTFSDFDVLPIIGGAKHRAHMVDRALRHSGGALATINYENLPWLVERLESQKKPWPFRTVVADESTKLKGFRLRQGTQRARALGTVAHKHVDRFIELTGTPSPRGLEDLWGQVWFLDGGQRLGRTFSAFTQRWFRPSFSGYGIEPLEHAQEDIQARIADICLSINAADYFDLREPVRNIIPVKLPAKARGLYRDMENKMFAEIDGHEVEAFNAAAKSMKCLQLANGAAYVDENAEKWVEVHDAKILALESVVEEAAGMPVLVAYHFRSDLARLMKAFPGALNVGTAEGLREAKKGKGRVWLGHPASMGHGVDGLQEHTNIMAFFGLNWNMEEHLQIIERIGPTRQMQAGFDRPVFVHYIVAEGTVDELVLQRIETRRSVQDILLEALKKRRG
jgi:hypothetical protein